MYSPRNPNDPRQVEACAMRSDGMTCAEIATKYGVSPSNISGWTSPVARNGLTKARTKYRSKPEVQEARVAAYKEWRSSPANRIRHNAGTSIHMLGVRGAPAEDRDVVEKMYRIAGWANHFSGANKYSPDSVEIDHIVPISLGGTSHPDNLQYLTRSENCSKGNQAA